MAGYVRDGDRGSLVVAGSRQGDLPTLARNEDGGFEAPVPRKLLKSGYGALQIAYAVNAMAEFQVTVHPVAGVEVDPPTGADTRTSLLLFCTPALNPPPTAYGWPAGQEAVAVVVGGTPLLAVMTTVPSPPGAPVGPLAPVAPLAPVGPCAPVGPVAPVGPAAPVAP